MNYTGSLTNASLFTLVVNTTLDYEQQLAADAAANGRTVATDIIVGVAMMVLSVACGVAYSLILHTIWMDPELIRMTSYKFMFLLGIFDVIQCFPHFVSGLFTIFQTTWNPWLAKVMGILATPCYVGYTVMTVVLSFQRFIQLLSPKLEQHLFTGRAVWLWLGLGIVFCGVFVVFLSHPEATIKYNPDWYSWDYDRELKFSATVQRIEMYIELSTIGISGFFYVFVVILLSRKRKRFLASSNYTTEIKILIQAAVITVYCMVLNVFWHNYEYLLPESLWSYMGLNFMWIFSSGVYPVIYFIVNRAIRDRVVRKKHHFSRAAASVFTRGDKSTAGPTGPSTDEGANTKTTNIVMKSFGEQPALQGILKKNHKIAAVT